MNQHQIIQPKMFYYGFPVALLTTCDIQGNNNITPISSTWCLGNNLVVGLGTQGKAFENLQQCPEAVLNLPDETMWQQVEKIAPFTGKIDVPDFQQGVYTFCANKFVQGGLSMQASELVRPVRIGECPIQAELKLSAVNEREGYAIIEFKIVQVYALPELVLMDNRINPEKWKPLIFNFRHYQGLTPMLGKNFRCDV